MFDCPTRAATSTIIRPEQSLPLLPKWYEKFVYGVKGVGLRLSVSLRRDRLLHQLLSQVKSLDSELALKSDTELSSEINALRHELAVNGYTPVLLGRAFALIREVSGRAMGMKHYDSQLTGGWYLFQGRVAEMATGEGKTLTATLPAAAAALAGIPVHVITVNDYLAARDCEEMRPVYEALGLSVGCIKQDMSVAQRQAVYACDVVYCTNNELVFDYLKDFLIIKDTPDVMHRHAEHLKGRDNAYSDLMLRGLHYAIIDEADSVCMDEARTPLIISAVAQVNEAETLMYSQALDIASQLDEEEHFTRYKSLKQVELSDLGEALIDELAKPLGAYWVGRVRRYELIRQALIATTYFIRDRHYLVRDDQIQIIDEHTGRVMPDRSWERGLHQLLEVKEGCALTASRETLAKMSYQRFFRRYRFFAGMTGTAKEVRTEFWDIYRKQVVPISTHNPLVRRYHKDRVFRTSAEQLAAIASAAQCEAAAGRAVLIGTTTVGESEKVAKALLDAGLEHEILNAKQDHMEADIISGAGHPGKITIATSMAGRGTDIKLHPEVERAGGLHVILCQLQDAGRIDRQLEGRCARFGDPGSVALMVSLDDAWLRDAWFLGWLLRLPTAVWSGSVSVWLMRRAQRSLERRHRKVRYRLLKTDEKQGETLAFTQGGL